MEVETTDYHHYQEEEGEGPVRLQSSGEPCGGGATTSVHQQHGVLLLVQLTNAQWAFVRSFLNLLTLLILHWKPKLSTVYTKLSTDYTKLENKQ